MNLVELRVETTKACNYACTHCYTIKARTSRLDQDRFFSLVEESAGAGATSLSLTGGEPLIHPSTPLGMSARASRFKMRRRLNTNAHLIGTTCSPDEVSSAFEEIQVSFHSMDPDRFDSFVEHKGAFRAVNSAVNQLCTIDPKRVSLRHSLCGSSAIDLPAIYQHASSLGIAKLKVRTSIQATGGLRVADEELQAMRKSIFKCIDLAASLQTHLEVHLDGLGIDAFDSPNISFPHCSCGSKSMFVSADGDVFPCVFVRERPELAIGNIERETLPVVIRNWRGRFGSSDRVCGGFEYGTAPKTSVPRDLTLISPVY